MSNESTPSEQVFYERRIRLKHKYKFENTEKFLKFIRLLMSKINFSQYDLKIKVINDFGNISTNNCDSFEEIIRNSKLIYNVDVEVTDNINTILCKFTEFESLYIKSYIKLQSYQQNWIVNCEEEITQSLHYYKRPFSFIQNNVPKLVLASLFSFFCFYIFWGPSTLKEITNPTDYLIHLVYTSVFFFFYCIITDLFMPTFKIMTKQHLFKRLKTSFKKENEINKICIIIAFISIITTIIQIIF